MDDRKNRHFKLEQSWQSALENHLNEHYMESLAAFVETERSLSVPIYPSSELVFNAFSKTPYDKVKVVIMGQDPYHGPGQAHGLSFSVPKGISIPPSLQNIFKELRDDLGIQIPLHGCLNSWSEQGVLLLNATLTVRQSEPMSHCGRGWERFTDDVIIKLSERKDPVIFVLWGKSAQKKCSHILLKGNFSGSHYLLTAPHPSPFSAHSGFFGCRHFSKVNEILMSLGKVPINWEIK